jgi:hypothetical protein
MKKSKDVTIKVNVEFTDKLEITNCEKLEKEIFKQFRAQLESEFCGIIPRDRSGDQVIWGLKFHYMPIASKAAQSLRNKATK